MKNNKLMYHSLKFRSPAMDAIESINRTLEPIRQMQAMTENLKSIYNTSNSAIDSLRNMRTAFDIANNNIAYSFNKRELFPVFTYVDSLNDFTKTLTTIKSNAFVFNSSILITQSSTSFPCSVYITPNTDVIIDYNDDESLTWNDQVYFKLVQLIYSQEIIDIKAIKDFMNQVLIPLYSLTLLSSTNDTSIYIYQNIVICATIINMCTFNTYENN